MNRIVPLRPAPDMPIRDAQARDARIGGETGAGSVLVIDVAAVCANYRLLRDRAAPAACAAVVKADAYGLGADRIGPALYAEGCRHFFVAHLDEGLSLCAVLPGEAQIFILNGLPPGAESACAAAGLVPVINSLGQLDRWAALARERGGTLPALLQVDSGMSRLGLAPEEVHCLAAAPERLAGVAVLYVMSHLACADEPDHPANRAQLDAFQDLRRHLPVAPASFANSAGIFLGPDYHFDLVRPGVALYGLGPVMGMANPMTPVVSLHTKVIQTREIAAGAMVGYGASHRADRVTRVATIALGYADGWPRSLSNRGAAYWNGQRLPIIGRVSMDSITLDASALAEDALVPGALVELIGPHQSADAVAQDCGTIGYEILTSLGRRHHRQYRGLNS